MARFNWQNSKTEIKRLRSHNTKDFPHPTKLGKRIKIQYGGLLHAYTDNGFEDIERELPDYSFPEGKNLEAEQPRYFIMDLPTWGTTKIVDGGKIVRVLDKKNVSIFRYSNPIVIEKGKAPYVVVDEDGKKVRELFDDRESIQIGEKIVRSEDAEEGTYEVINNKLYLKLPTLTKNTFPLQVYDDIDTASVNNKDAYITAGAPTTNYGTGANLVVYTETLFHSLIHFTLSVGSGVISAVKLYLYKYYDVAGYTCPAVNIHQLTQTGWTELGVTWNKYDGTNNWATAGGDYSATVVDTTNSPLPQGTYGWENWDLGPGATNPISGLNWGSNVHLLLRYPSAGKWITYWYSKEGTYVPYVEITYTPAAGWTGKISGVTNPAKVMGVDVADIAKVKGVA